MGELFQVLLVTSINTMIVNTLALFNHRSGKSINIPIAKLLSVSNNYLACSLIDISRSIREISTIPKKEDY